MKKILALLLAVVMVLGMVACASKTETPAETTTTEPAATETTEETKTEEPAAEETTEEPAEETGAVIQKVALVTDVGTIDDESFNQATWQGVKAYCEANGIEYTYYQPTEDSTEARSHLHRSGHQGRRERRRHARLPVRRVHRPRAGEVPRRLLHRCRRWRRRSDRGLRNLL